MKKQKNKKLHSKLIQQKKTKIKSAKELRRLRLKEIIKTSQTTSEEE